MPPSPQHQPGQRFAERYELREVLGMGGFGEVWLALDLSVADRPVALKILQPNRARELRVRERFIREAELLTKLNHPSIPRALDWRCDDAGAFMVLEYAEGQTLARRLLRLRAEPEPDTLRPLLEVFQKTCGAVHHALSAGVVHRDLKPPNILIVEDAGDLEVRVLDFGLAKILDADRSDETTKGRVLGSQNYLSPEQLTSEEISNAADIFALGTILFELLTARRTWLIGTDGQRLKLWEHSNLGPNEVVDVVARILRGPRPLVSDYRPSYPRAIDEVVTRALAVDPKARWSSAVELADATWSAMAEWLEETRPTGLVAPSRPEGGNLPLANDEQWAIPTNSGQIEEALAAPPKAAEAALDVVVPTELDAPSGELSFSSQGHRFIDTYAPFVRRRGPAKSTRWQRALGLLVSAVLSIFFAIGVLSGVTRVWEEIAKRRHAPGNERPVVAFGVVKGAPAEEEQLVEAGTGQATEPPAARGGNPARAAGPTTSSARPATAEWELEPTVPEKNTPARSRLRRIDEAMKDMRASIISDRAHPDKFLLAVAVLRTAIERDLPSSEASIAGGALDVAVRSMEVSRLERAYRLYRKFAFPSPSDEETIDPLD